MRKYMIAVSMIAVVAILLGYCFFTKEVDYSDNILFSINNGAAGFGTIADCTDATIVVYKDRTVRVFMHTENYPEIAVITLSEEDYNALAELASPAKISRLKTVEDWATCDGSSYYITVYGLNDEELLSKGGYMPIGKKFWKMYKGIKEVLESYGIPELVDEYRKEMEMKWE